MDVVLSVDGAVGDACRSAQAVGCARPAGFWPAVPSPGGRAPIGARPPGTAGNRRRALGTGPMRFAPVNAGQSRRSRWDVAATRPQVWDRRGESIAHAPDVLHEVLAVAVELRPQAASVAVEGARADQPALPYLAGQLVLGEHARGVGGELAKQGELGGRHSTGWPCSDASRAATSMRSAPTVRIRRAPPRRRRTTAPARARSS